MDMEGLGRTARVEVNGWNRLTTSNSGSEVRKRLIQLEVNTGDI